MARLDGQRFTNLALAVFEILREAKIQGEDFVDTFTRLIGIKPNLDATQAELASGDQSSRTNTKVLEKSNTATITGQAGGTVVDGFLKSSEDSAVKLRVLCAQYLDNLLSFIDRWAKTQVSQQERRLKRLVGENVTSADQLFSTGLSAGFNLVPTESGANQVSSDTVDIAQIVKDVQTGLKAITESRAQPLKEFGELTLRLTLFELIGRQIDAIIAAVPVARLGELGGFFTDTLRSTVIGLNQQEKRLQGQRRAVGTELIRLQRQRALVIDGIPLETGEKLSLRNFLQGMLFLCQSEYKCKNCAFLSTGIQISDVTEVDRINPTTGHICTFSFEGDTGRPTTPEQSCLEVWNRPGNDFWTASVDFLVEFTNEVDGA